MRLMPFAIRRAYLLAMALVLACTGCLGPCGVGAPT
jgi:hypothetical protein